MGVCWVTAEFAVGFGGAETPQISAVTQQISHGNHDIFKVTGWLATANLAGNIGTPDFDVFPGRLCGQQISERLLGNSWIMNLGNYKGGIMVDPNKARLKSCKETVVVSTARKYVSKAKSFQDFCMKRKRWVRFNTPSFYMILEMRATLTIGSILAIASWVVWSITTTIKGSIRNLKKCTARFVIAIDSKSQFFHFLKNFS